MAFLPSRAAPLALQPPPTLYVTGVYPRGGPTAGGTSVTIRGAVSELRSCRFGTSPPTPAFFANGTATCVAPPSNSSGDATLTLNDRTTPSLDPHSAAPAALLGGRLTFRYYSASLLGVEPVSVRAGERLKLHVRGLGGYIATYARREGWCAVGGGRRAPLTAVHASWVECAAPEPSAAASYNSPLRASLSLNGADSLPVAGRARNDGADPPPAPPPPPPPPPPGRAPRPPLRR